MSLLIELDEAVRPIPVPLCSAASPVSLYYLNSLTQSQVRTPISATNRVVVCQVRISFTPFFLFTAYRLDSLLRSPYCPSRAISKSVSVTPHVIIRAYTHACRHMYPNPTVAPNSETGEYGILLPRPPGCHVGCFEFVSQSVQSANGR